MTKHDLLEHLAEGVSADAPDGDAVDPASPATEATAPPASPKLARRTSAGGLSAGSSPARSGR
jgi:hypothetical protein